MEKIPQRRKQKKMRKKEKMREKREQRHQPDPIVKRKRGSSMETG